MLRKLLLAVVAAALSTLVVAGIASAQPTTTTTRYTDSETFNEEVCDGEFADITLDYRAVLHITDFGDGRYHVTGAQVGTVTWEQDGVTYTGKFTQSFGENSNTVSFTGTFTVSGHVIGDDGTRVRVKGLAHITINANGEITSEIEQFSFDCG